jgi:prephenate dehydratase
LSCGGAGGGAEGEKSGQEDGEKAQGTTTGRYKSLVSFMVPHRTPGALASVLDVFRTYGLNLTNINSVPGLVRPFQHLFFVEFEGSREHDPEGKVKSALGEVGRVAESCRWLGSWESSQR